MTQQNLARWLKCILAVAGLCALAAYAAVLPLEGQRLCAAYPEFSGWFFPWLIFLWLSGLLDAVDGDMARRSGRSSVRGAQMDIISDRLVELSIVWGLALRRPDCLLPLLGLVSAILISMTVFLTTGMLTPKKGKKSFYYQAGLMERTEGFLAFTAMMLFPSALSVLTWIYAGLIGITILQRLIDAHRIIKEMEEEAHP